MKNSKQENIQNINPEYISPETIDYYMQKSQQERSDFIYKIFTGIKCQISFFFQVIGMCKNSNGNSKETTRHCEFQTTHTNK